MTPESKTLNDYFATLRAHKWLILAVISVSLGAGLAYSLLKRKSYTASATIQFSDPTSELPILTPSQLPTDLEPDKTVAANATVVSSNAIVNAVKAALSGASLTDMQLRDNVSATVEPDSDLVDITFTSHRAALAARVADEFAQQTMLAERASSRALYASQAANLQSLTAGNVNAVVAQTYRIAIARLRLLSKVADPVSIQRTALVPTSPSSPKPVVDTLLAVFLGAIIAVIAAFLRSSLDKTLRSPRAAQQELDLRIVGRVRADTLGSGFLNGTTAGAISDEELESFRILRQNVDFLGPEARYSVLVTSPLPEEGKSTVAAWYAYASAAAGRRTMLVECDLRRPVLAERFNLKHAPGLSDYVSGRAEPNEVLQQVVVAGDRATEPLVVVTAGENRSQPSELVSTDRFRAFVEEVTSVYDVVVLDSAPLLPVSDTLELLPSVDRVLLCVRIGQTTVDQAQAAKEAILNVPTRPVGLVATGVRPGSDGDYYQYYYSQTPVAATPSGA